MCLASQGHRTSSFAHTNNVLSQKFQICIHHPMRPDFQSGSCDLAYLSLWSVATKKNKHSSENEWLKTLVQCCCFIIKQLRRTLQKEHHLTLPVLVRCSFILWPGGGAGEQTTLAFSEWFGGELTALCCTKITQTEPGVKINTKCSCNLNLETHHW